MEKKLVLTQIMKNESHVAERMLNSILPIVDAICVIDTGSEDNSIEVVENWGKKNNIKTLVYKRPFDNFENSRNYSIKKAKENFKDNKEEEWYGFWLDFDEEMIISSDFNKSIMNKDIYMLNTIIGTTEYTRNEVFKLSEPFEFYGPVHEYLIHKGSKNPTNGLLDGLKVNVNSDGASWKEDLPSKYKKHAFTLENYIDNDRTDPRWIFYTAQSWHDSSLTENREEDEERLRRSLKYYKERASRKDGYQEEIFYSEYRIGSIMGMLEFPWGETMQQLLKCHSIDPLRCEPISLIIEHYIKMGDWNNAYLYSKFAKVNFYKKSPYPKRLLFIDQPLYEWKILEYHSISSYYTNRRLESSSNFKELLEVLDKKPNLFTNKDIQKIENNSKFFL